MMAARANSRSGEIAGVANARRTRAASRVQEGFAIEEASAIISARTDDHPPSKTLHPRHFANWHGCSASSFADVGRFYESHHFLSFLGIDRRYSSPEELGDFPK